MEGEKKKGGRPPGPKKVELTITLTEPISEWLSYKLEHDNIGTKSAFIEKLLAAEKEREKARKGV